MVSLAKKYLNKPFHLISSHVQNVPQNKVLDFVKRSGVTDKLTNFSVHSQCRHPDHKSKGIPSAAVFDHTGTLIYTGSPSNMKSIIDKAIKKAPLIYFGPLKYTTEVSKLLTAVEKKRGVGNVITKLESIIEEGDNLHSLEKTEAQDLLKRVLKYYKNQKKHALMQVDFNPSEATKILNDLSKELRGSKLSQEIAAKLKSLKANPGFKASLKVNKTYNLVLKKLTKMKPCLTHKNQGSKIGHLSCLECCQHNESTIKSSLKMLRNLLEKNPGLPITSKVQKTVSMLEENFN